MAEVAPAVLAHDLCAGHAHGDVLVALDGVGEVVVERGPPAPGIELGSRPARAPTSASVQNRRRGWGSCEAFLSHCSSEVIGTLRADWAREMLASHAARQVDSAGQRLPTHRPCVQGEQFSAERASLLAHAPPRLRMHARTHETPEDHAAAGCAGAVVSFKGHAGMQGRYRGVGRGARVERGAAASAGVGTLLSVLVVCS